MRVCRVSIGHFRGIKAATVLLPKHAVLIGDNNTGKTTILEALDLALGPDRLNHLCRIWPLLDVVFIARRIAIEAAWPHG